MLFSLITPVASVKADNINEWATAHDVPLDKEWRIHLTQLVAEGILFEDFIYVVDQNKQRVDVLVGLDPATSDIVVTPPFDGYAPKQRYTLVIEEGLVSTNNNRMMKTIHKDFVTGTARIYQPFVPRTDSENKVVTVKNFYQITTQQLMSFDYDSGQIALTKDEEYKKGDILSFPETTAYPLGYIVKVTSVVEKEDRYSVSYVDAALEDYIVDVDISQQVSIGIDDVTLADNLVQEHFTERYLSALNIMKPNATLKEKPSGFSIVLEDIGMEVTNTSQTPGLTGEGGFKINGEIEFADIMVNIDANNWAINEASLTAEQLISIGVDVYGKFEGRAEIPLIEQAIPSLGLNLGFVKLGVMFESTLVLTFGADGKISMSVEKSIKQQVGVKNNEGSLKPFAHFDQSKTPPKVEEAEIQLMMGQAIDLDFKLRVAQTEFASIGTTPEIQTNIKYGNLYNNSLQNACYEKSIDLYLTANVGLFKEQWQPYALQHALLRDTSCELPQLKFTEDKIELKPGETKQLFVEGIFSSGETNQLKLPHDYITFKSEDAKYIRVDANGKVYVQPTAPVNNKFIVTASIKGREQAVELAVFVKDPDQKELNEGLAEPEAINSYKNYEIINDSATRQTLIAPSDSHYVTYNEDNRIVGEGLVVYFNKLEVPANSKTYVTQLDANAKEVITSPHPQVSVKEVNTPAMEKYSLKQGEKVKIKANADVGRVRVMLRAPRLGVNYNFANYYEDLTLNNYGYKQNISTSISHIDIRQGGEANIENTSMDTFDIYLPKETATVLKTDEAPLIHYRLAPKTSIKLTTSEALGYIKSSTMVYMYNHSDEPASYNLLNMNYNGKVLSMNREEVLQSNRNKLLYIRGDYFVENTSDTTLDLYGPSKLIKVEEGQGKLYAEHNLLPGEAVSVTSLEPVILPSSVSISAQTNLGETYLNTVSFGYQAAPTLLVPLVTDYTKKQKVTTKATSLRTDRGKQYIENVGNEPVTIFAPRAYITEYESIPAPIFKEYELLPGQSVDVTTKEVGTAIKSPYARIYSYESTQYNIRYRGSNDLEGTNNTIYEGKSSNPLALRSLSGTVVTNIGNAPLYIYGLSEYLTFK